MKMLKLAGAIAFVGLLTPLAANAADGTITFSGLLLDTSCGVQTVTGGGTVTNGNFSVTLPSVLATALPSDGTTAGATPFTMVISGCPTSLATAKAYFSGTNINTDGYLKNTDETGGVSGAASNVELQLLNGDSSSIDLHGLNSASQGVAPATMSNGNGQINLQVQYHATGAATAGSVTSTVDYTIEYN